LKRRRDLNEKSVTPAPLYGSIEAGGTKFCCAIGSGPDHILAEERLPTTTPEETLGRAAAFFQRAEEEGHRLEAMGIACFGPVDCRPQSPTFGYITTTPKKGWEHSNVVGYFRQSLPSLPIAFDTDVNGAALAEWRWGAARDLDTCLYVTVGTGIGGGYVIRGESIKGLLHPEMGHVRVQQAAEDRYAGHCPYHGACLEGLAAGPSIEDRWQCRSAELAPEHQAWTFESDYLGQAVAGWILTLSPECIVLGGGVMDQAHLFPGIRRRVKELLNGYVSSPLIEDEDPTYICPPGLPGRSGILGGIALAERAAAKTEKADIC
jgi:fructokinase